MENNSTLKAIAGLITLIVLCFTMCTTCGDDKSEENKDPNAQFYGAYTLYDAYNHKIIITVSEGGNAIYTMDASTINNDVLSQAAWGKATKGIDCVWDFVYRSKGGKSHKGIEVKGNGVKAYLGGGYAYSTYSDFADFRNGMPYEFEEE